VSVYRYLLETYMQLPWAPICSWRQSLHLLWTAACIIHSMWQTLNETQAGFIQTDRNCLHSGWAKGACLHTAQTHVCSHAHWQPG
jgi:hypothetical protein